MMRLAHPRQRYRTPVGGGNQFNAWPANCVSIHRRTSSLPRAIKATHHVVGPRSFRVPRTHRRRRHL